MKNRSKYGVNQLNKQLKPFIVSYTTVLSALDSTFVMAVNDSLHLKKIIAFDLVLLKMMLLLLRLFTIL